MKRTGQQLTAWILAILIAVTSAQLPVIPACAQEQAQTLTSPSADEGIGAPDSGQQIGTPDEEKPETSDGENPGTPDEEKPETPDEEKPETPDEEKPETPDEEKPETPDEEKPETPDEEKPETPDEEKPEMPDEEMIGSVSSNTLSALMSDGDLTEIPLNLDGVYQFGGAPTESAPSSSPIRSRKASRSGETLEDYLYRQLVENRKQNAEKVTIDISAYNITDANALGLVYSGVLNENPDLYDIDKQALIAGDGTSYTTLKVSYTLGLDHDLWRLGFERAKKAVTNPNNKLQTAIELHDYLAVNCEYDKEHFDADPNSVPTVSHSTYGVFANRVAVCDGYSLAYKYLLKQFGINCYMVNSAAMAHAWNLIELNGQYYQVDVTWDDPAWDLVGRACHSYMFKSDTAFVSAPAPYQHYDWKVTQGSSVVPLTATDTSYDYAFWADSTAPLVFDEAGACYYTAYTSNKSSIYKKTAALSSITTPGTEFHTIINGGYNSALSGLFRIGSRLYYNDYGNIYSIAINDASVNDPVFTPTDPGSIYGCAYYPENPADAGSEYKIHYSLHNNPNLTAKETVLIAKINDLPQPEDPIPALLTRPTKTTYLVGADTVLDLTGGSVNYSSEGGRKTVPLTMDMISGFSPSTAGIQAVEVTYDPDEDPLSFHVLMVEVPELTQPAVYGQTLNIVSLSTYHNQNTGTYSWQDGTTSLTTIGEREFPAKFRPTNLTDFQEIDLKIRVTVSQKSLASATVTLTGAPYVYDKTEKKPAVTVKLGSTTLVPDRDYTLAYQDNINAGEATVTVAGTGIYGGSIDKTFTINPKPITIKAKNMTIYVGDPLPTTDSYEYEAVGLIDGDALLTPPAFTCAIGTTNIKGIYNVKPHDADAGPNYKITSYTNALLTVVAKPVTYTVRFDVQGHGTPPAALTELVAGSRIAAPEPPTAKGYLFEGWYKDAACTAAWHFDTDTVLADITLYAKWSRDGGIEEGGLFLSEIEDAIYNGRAYKPTLTVHDGETLLKAGRDYTLRYYNNINANAGGVLKGDTFNPALPYVELTGRGSYSAVIKINFNILPRSIGDGSETPASDVYLRITDQITTINKVMKPFYLIRSASVMRQDKDFSLRLTAINAFDQSGKSVASGTELAGAAVPAGYKGEFLLTITGLGNYTGSLTKKIYVADRTHLIQNMAIVLGRNLRNLSFTGAPITLTPSDIDTPDTFTVKYGRNILRYGTDYTVSYRNNDRVGKAELIVTGIGAYAGTKTAVFNITGKAFNLRTVRVNGIENKVYTSLPLTQENLSLIYNAGKADEQTLVKDTHYTVTYARNINAGNASVTFTGLPQAGFTGSVIKTFRITPAPITDTTQAAAMNNLSFRYDRSGIMPVDEIALTNPYGSRLQNRTDYTLRYLNNRNIAEKTDKKPPTVIVRGRGNYTGELKVFFTIRKADFDKVEDGLLFTATSIPYLPDKPADYAYKPVINVTDGRTRLRLGRDYTITYLDNTQADYESFIKTLNEDPKKVHPIPRAVITPTANSPYLSSHTVLLPVYLTKLTKNNLTVRIIGDTYYTGGQLRPQVEVTYNDENGSVLLEEGINKDYTVDYGANKLVGRNRGSVTIYGTSPNYGGYVTVSFDIQRKPLSK